MLRIKYIPSVQFLFSIIATLALVVIASRTGAQEKTGEMERAQKEYQAKLAKAHGDYVALLRDLVEKRTKAGDLEGAIVIRHELQETQARGPFKLYEPMKDKKAPLKRSVAGVWRFSYGNKTAHVRTIDADGKVDGGGGNLSVRGDDLVIQFATVIERLTLAGDRLLVEHYNPASDYPNKPPDQIGIGVRVGK